MSHIEIPPEDRVDRTGLLDLQANPHKKFALFVRGSNPSGAKFKFAFATQKEAYAKAQEYSAKRVADGHFDFTFYVIEIKQMIGIENNKLVDLELP